MALTSNGELTPQGKAILLTAAPLAAAAVWAFVGLEIPDIGPQGVKAIETVRNNILIAFGAATVLAVFLLNSRMQTGTARPMGLDAFLTRLGNGDFRDALRVAKQHTLLTRTEERLIEELANRAEEVKEASYRQMKLLENSAMLTTTLNEALTQQMTNIEDITVSAARTIKSRESVDGSIDGLSHSSEEGSTSVLEMVAINNEVRENIHNLVLSVQETTTAIEEMTFSSKEVARNIEELSTAAEETAASMNQMDVSISQVESNANETSKLSDTVTRDAETGVAAINHTIRGIDKIKESSRVAAEVISNLGQKINEIGNILNVIDDVAEQTNLLALNAAIIAAQAGEHGRGFAVVADEIKALAERTGASTKEIAGLIKTIQDESRNAVSVMARGVEDVEDGVRLGHNAEDALRKIVESAKRSTLMIQAIAQATVEQAKGSKQVTNAISRIAETVQQIAYASAEQAKGSEHIMQSAEQMKIITQQVERSAEEQNKGGRQVTQSIETIREITERLTEVQRVQTDDGEIINRASTQVTETTQRCLETGRKLERLMGEAAQSFDEQATLSA